MRRGRLAAVAVVLALGAGAWWWSARGPVAPSASSGMPASEDDGQEVVEPQLEGQGRGRGVAGSRERIEAALKGEARREKPDPEAGPELVVVKCIVVDEKGEPVPKARVRVRRIEKTKKYLVVSGDQELVTHFDGSFRCAMPEGQDREVMVMTREEHSASHPKTIASDAPETTLVVQRVPNLAGVVLDDRGLPIENAHVTVVGEEQVPTPGALGSWPRERYTLTTDEAGVFSVRIPPREGPLGLSVRAPPKSASAWTSLERVRAVLGSTDLVLRFPAPAYIEGRVEGEDGLPAQGGRVFVGRGRHMTLETMPFIRERSPTGTIGAGGGFKVGPLVPGSYRLLVDVRDPQLLGPEPVAVEAPIDGVVVVCPSAPSIQGRLVGEASEDLSGFHVSAVRDDPGGLVRTSEAQVASDGTFEVNLLGGETYRLYAHKAGDMRLAELRHVRPSRGAVDMRLQKGRAIAGWIHGGSAEAGRTVQASRNGIKLKTRADVNGRYRFTGLAGGYWAIDIFVPGHALIADRVEVEAGNVDVVLRP